jgi:hypothetical protein
MQRIVAHLVIQSPHDHGPQQMGWPTAYPAMPRGESTQWFGAEA